MSANKIKVSSFTFAEANPELLALAKQLPDPSLGGVICHDGKYYFAAIREGKITLARMKSLEQRVQAFKDKYHYCPPEFQTRK